MLIIFLFVGELDQASNMREMTALRVRRVRRRVDSGQLHKRLLQRSVRPPIRLSASVETSRALCSPSTAFAVL